MRERLNAYFAKKSRIRACFAVICAAYVLCAVLYGFASFSPMAEAMELLLMVFLVLIFVCFVRHNVNGMQCAIGAYLGSFLISSLSYVGASIETAATAAVLAVAVLILITHLYLISRRKGNRKALFLNQLVGACYMLVCVGVSVGDLISMGLTLPALSGVFANIFFAAAINMIVTIETRINEYKIRRDALTSDGKWNDAAKADLKKEIFG